MPSISIGFSRPRTWKPFAWIIMKGYGTDYSHVYIKFRSEKYDRQMIYQASASMVNFMGESVFYKNSQVVESYEVEISDAARSAMILFAIDNAGKPYSMKNVLGLAAVRVAEIFGFKIKNPLSDGRETFVCSELVWDLLVEAGLIPPSSSDEVTPKQVRDLMASLPKSRLLIG